MMSLSIRNILTLLVVAAVAYYVWTKFLAGKI